MVLLDFEMAAISAFREVFPEAVHFAKAVQRNVGQNGLEPVYRRVPPFDAPEFQAVRPWIRRFIGMAVSPPQYHRVLWNRCLNTPPRTGHPLIDAQLNIFRDYLLNEWLPNRDKSLLWNHFDHDGPRTTNHAESYHNGLSHVFDRRRPSLGVYLGTMQGVQNEIRNSIRQLQLGAAPHERRMEYVRNDNNITLAKEALQNWTDAVPELQNAPADIPPDIEQNLLARLLQHLDRIQHNIGIQ